MYCYTNIDSVFPIQAKEIVEEARRIAEKKERMQILELIKVRNFIP